LEKRVAAMKVSYKKLWKLLIDRDMKKKDLQLAAGLSSTTIAKLSNHENVSMEVLKKVCTTLSVDFGDIMELVPDQTDNNKSDSL
jgi:DNA-binding Xre family transcriptional regulator